MDVLSVITAVYTLAKGINDWLDERVEKELAVRQISATVTRIQNILLTFKTAYSSGNIEPHLFDSIYSLGDVLKRTQEHLLVWEFKRSRRLVAFLSPSTVIRQIKEDEQLLNQQLILLLTSIAVVGYISHHKGGTGSGLTVAPADSLSPVNSSEALVLGTVRNEEVRRFWCDFIGEKVPFIHSDEFFSRLRMGMGIDFNEAARYKLLLRLDEFGIGGVTPLNLEDMVGSSSLKNTIKMYMKEDVPRTPQTPIIPTSSWSTTELRLPLLIFIDDNPANIAYEASFASRLGINVIELTSTALAKSWIESHSDFLRQNDHPSSVRFISDNHRDEPAATPFLNISAGENILRYLRGRQYSAPVLIYAGASIHTTGYVLRYRMAGSTLSSDVCLKYISDFAAGRNDDFAWKQYMA